MIFAAAPITPHNASPASYVSGYFSIISTVSRPPMESPVTYVSEGLPYFSAKYWRRTSVSTTACSTAHPPAE